MCVCVYIFSCFVKIFFCVCACVLLFLSLFACVCVYFFVPSQALTETMDRIRSSFLPRPFVCVFVCLFVCLLEFIFS